MNQTQRDCLEAQGVCERCPSNLISHCRMKWHKSVAPLLGLEVNGWKRKRIKPKPVVKVAKPVMIREPKPPKVRAVKPPKQPREPKPVKPPEPVKEAVVCTSCDGCAVRAARRWGYCAHCLNLGWIQTGACCRCSEVEAA